MVTLHASANAKHRRCILLCTDANYECYAFALIERIVKKTPNLAADICLISEHEISIPKTLRHLDVRLCQITVDRGDIEFPENAHVTFSAYLRHFSMTALADTYDRILYLDSDIDIAGSDLADLLSLQLLDGHAVGAVRDRSQQRNLMLHPKDALRNNLPRFPFLNSGVLLVDTDNWLAQDILQRMLETIREYGHNFVFTDQSALNLTLRGDWSELSWHWNFIVQPDLVYRRNRIRPTVLHFAGSKKPWHTDKWSFPKGTSQRYERFLASHYPGKIGGAGAQPDRLMRFEGLRAFNHHLRGGKQYRTYEQRFTNKRTVLDPWDQ